MYKSHHEDFLIYFCKVGCEVNKQADQSGSSSQYPGHVSVHSTFMTKHCDSSLAATVMWPNIALPSGRLAHMETEITSFVTDVSWLCPYEMSKYDIWYCNLYWIKVTTEHNNVLLYIKKWTIFVYVGCSWLIRESSWTYDSMNSIVQKQMFSVTHVIL